MIADRQRRSADAHAAIMATGPSLTTLRLGGGHGVGVCDAEVVGGAGGGAVGY
jgi:hypothetical protein